MTEMRYVEPFRIFGNLWYVGNSDVGAYLIDTGDGSILIDTTYPTTVAWLIQSLWAAGCDPARIKYILHTHGHFDHIGGTRFLIELSGAKTALGARDAAMFRDNPALILADFCPGAVTEVFVPDMALEDGGEITLGNTTVRVIATPGHSDGVVSYFFDVTDGENTYRAGLFGGAGVNTLSKAFITHYGNTHSRAEFLASLDRVRLEKVDITLGNHAAQARMLEKHAAQTEGNANPFIDRGEWRRLIDGTEEKLRSVMAKENTGVDVTRDVYVFLFAGQSNMAGRGIASLAPRVPTGWGYEYRAITAPDRLSPLVEPFGMAENKNGGVSEAGMKTGSLVSAFVNAAYPVLQVPIVGVSCSKGASTIDEWAPGGAYCTDAIARLAQCREYLAAQGFRVAGTHVLWCQGCTDGDRATPPALYAKKTRALFAAFFAARIDRAFVIQIGNHRDFPDLYRPIQDAQEELCSDTASPGGRISLVSRLFKTYSAKGLMKDEFHYQQAAYNEVGTEAGKNTARILRE